MFIPLAIMKWLHGRSHHTAAPLVLQDERKKQTQKSATFAFPFEVKVNLQHFTQQSVSCSHSLTLGQHYARMPNACEWVRARVCACVGVCVHASFATALTHFPLGFLNWMSPLLLFIYLLCISSQMGAASGAPCTPSLLLSGTSHWV